ncbi:MAG: quinone-dependent dihydroorotate dehydrogenase [Xanthobacteraceae bacterium]
MIRFFDRLARPLLYALDPERAHRLAIRMFESLPLPQAAPDDRRLATRAFGLDFKNPIGIAAGFDKHGEAADALLRLGFGFVEVGTVTPRPQIGNPRPRLFRLDADHAVINRLGFNSQGADAVFRRLDTRAGAVRARAGRGDAAAIVGINVGANKDSPDRIADYVGGIERFAPIANYITLNISSPNTPGLRNLQQAASLDDLLARAVEARERLAQNAGPTPLLLKIAPDLSLDALDDVVGIARSRRIDGMIVGNTTIARPATLRAAAAKEAGGLSGRPLFVLATRMLAETYVRVEGAFPLIGTGGIDSGDAALAKIRAGASLIQIYSGLVFRGLDLLAEIKRTLIGALERERRNDLKECIGVDAASLTVERWSR